MTKQVVAWETWREKNAGSFALDNLGTDPQYLFNRLWRAFHEGYSAGVNEPAVQVNVDMVTALEAAERFISNGVALGYVVIPANDPAADTLPKIRAAIQKAKARLTA